MILSSSAQVLVVATRIMLGGVFVVTSTGKLVRARDFKEVIASMKIIPVFATWWAARIIAFVELTIGCAMISSVKPVVSAFAGLSLLAIFTVVLATKVASGVTDLKCGCFGKHSRITAAAVIRNLVLMMLCVASMNTRTVMLGYAAAAVICLSSWTIERVTRRYLRPPSHVFSAST
jgi:hypothetical protein